MLRTTRHSINLSCVILELEVHDHETMKREEKMPTPKFRPLRNAFAILVLSLCLWLAGRPLSSVWGAQTSTKPSVAYGVISNAVTPLWIAQDQGIFRKYGLDPD